MCAAQFLFTSLSECFLDLLVSFVVVVALSLLEALQRKTILALICDECA